jgi:hypothetical protein
MSWLAMLIPAWLWCCLFGVFFFGIGVLIVIGDYANLAWLVVMPIGAGLFALGVFAAKRNAGNYPMDTSPN